MKSRNILAAALLALVAMFCNAAQSPQEKPASIDAVIGANDEITIMALGAEDISKAWRVSSTGDVTLPMVGKIEVAGMTTEQVEQELTSRLRRFIIDPQVTIYVSEFRSTAVTVEGAVEKPGRLQTEGRKPLLTILMLAGGTKSPGPTLKITRTSNYGLIPLPNARRALDGTYSTVELPVKDALDASSPAANLIIEPGDVISVSTQKRLVYIMGEVNHPGAVELVTQDSISVVEVLAVAGGMTKLAARNNTAILRRDAEGRYDPIGSVNIKEILAGKSEDKLLLVGDIVIVPSSKSKTFLETATMAAITGSITSGFLILSRY